jgi:hypothetical protein
MDDADNVQVSIKGARHNNEDTSLGDGYLFGKYQL